MVSIPLITRQRYIEELADSDDENMDKDEDEDEDYLKDIFSTKQYPFHLSSDPKLLEIVKARCLTLDRWYL
jgi:hypothetical protein